MSGSRTYGKVLPKTNLMASTDPTVNDDSTKGYSVDSLWINQTEQTVWKLIDSSAGAAVWINLSSGSGGSEWTELARFEAAGDANIDFTGLDNAYSRYRIRTDGYVVCSNGLNTRPRLYMLDNGIPGNGYYFAGFTRRSNSTGFDIFQGTNFVAIDCGLSVGGNFRLMEQGLVVCDLADPVKPTSGMGSFNGYNGATYATLNSFSFVHNSASAYDGISIREAFGGLYTGTFVLEGSNK